MYSLKISMSSICRQGRQHWRDILIVVALFINNRWSMKMVPTLAKVYLGKEGWQGWMTDRSNITRWKGDSG